MILKLGIQHKGLKLHKFYINADPELLVLTYFMAMSNWVTYTIEWGNCYLVIIEENMHISFEHGSIYSSKTL